MNTRISSLPYLPHFTIICAPLGGCLELLASGWVRRTNSRREGGDCKGIFLPRLAGHSSSQQAPSLQPLSLGSGIPSTVVPSRLIVVILPQLSTALFLVVS